MGDVMPMFWGNFKTHAIPEVKTIEECEALLDQDVIVLFKHSSTCGTSIRARSEVMRFCAAHPDTPVHLMSVWRRELMSYVQERSGVEHESPQILVFRRGEIVATASHGDITAALLKSLLSP